MWQGTEKWVPKGLTHLFCGYGSMTSLFGSLLFWRREASVLLTPSTQCCLLPQISLLNPNEQQPNEVTWLLKYHPPLWYIAILWDRPFVTHDSYIIYRNKLKLDRKKVQVQLFKYASSLFTGRYRKTYSPLNKGKISFGILSGILGLAFLFLHVKYFSFSKSQAWISLV